MSDGFVRQSKRALSLTLLLNYCRQPRVPPDPAALHVPLRVPVQVRPRDGRHRLGGDQQGLRRHAHRRRHRHQNILRPRGNPAPVAGRRRRKHIRTRQGPRVKFIYLFLLQTPDNNSFPHI